MRSTSNILRDSISDISMASRTITVAGFTFELGAKLDEFDEEELYQFAETPI